MEYFKSERGKSKKDVRKGVFAGGTIKKSRSIRVINQKEVGIDDPIEYFFPMRV